MTEPLNTDPQPTPDESPRKLRRSAADQVIGGVAGGLGQYFELDPILIRIAFVLLALAGGSGVLLYILLWIVIPEATPEEDVVAAGAAGGEVGGFVLGGALVVIGAFLLLRQFIPRIDSEVLWALLLVALGGYILLKGVRR